MSHVSATIAKYSLIFAAGVALGSIVFGKDRIVGPTATVAVVAPRENTLDENTLGAVPQIFAASAALPEQQVEVSNFRLECLNHQSMDNIRHDLKNLVNIYENCLSDLSIFIGNFAASDKTKRVIFSSLAAHAMAPYGPSSSFQLPDLLSDENLDCDNYATLSAYLIDEIIEDEISIRFVGFDGGAVGNHAQLIVEMPDGETLLLDPTIGLFTRIGFDDLLRGKNPQSQIYRFQVHDQANVDLFADRVIKSVREGLYKPSDLLYYFSDLESFVQFAESSKKLWEERNIDNIVDLYTTPAAEALRKNLEQNWGRAVRTSD